MISRMMFRTLKPQLVVLLLFICVSFGCNGTEQPSNGTGQPSNTSASGPQTEFPMPPLNGASINNLGWTFSGGKRNVFSDFKGKVLILDFYATWCEPCRRSVPHLIELQKKYEDQGLHVIGLNVGGEDDEAKVPDFANEFGIQYTLARPDDELVTFLMANNDAI